MSSTSAPQPHPSPWGYPGQAPAARNGVGVAALVVGIVAVVSVITVVGGVLLGIVAIVLGVLGRSRVKRGEATNRGAATTGLVLGLVGILLSAGLLVGGVSLFHHLGGSTLVKCIQQANGNQTKLTQCQQQFKAKNGQ